MKPAKRKNQTCQGSDIRWYYTTGNFFERRVYASKGLLISMTLAYALSGWYRG